MSKSDIGNYSYSDNGYNNPHAAVAIGGNAHIYDNNGNLISDGNWTHGWDYDNRLINSTNGSSAINYSYGQDGNRLTYSDGTATTTYVNKYFNISNAGKITKNLFLGDQLIATIEANGTSTKNAYYVHTDHLGGSNVITNDNGAIVQLLDYYPFGAMRLNEKQSSFDEKKKYTGHEHDGETELNYMVARYQDGNASGFISIDPVLQGNIPKAFLTDPQQLNSYSYVKNNPLKYTDPTGLTTVVNQNTGEVIERVNDCETSIVGVTFKDGARTSDLPKIIGYSAGIDTFNKGDIIHIGVDKTNNLFNSTKSWWEPNAITAYRSRSGGKYDLKSQWGDKNSKTEEGYLLNNRYITLRDFGNVLAGMNARIGGTSFDDFQRMAGALHTNGFSAVPYAYIGGAYGSPPLYGEEETQYRASYFGYYNLYSDHSASPVWNNTSN